MDVFHVIMDAQRHFEMSTHIESISKLCMLGWKTRRNVPHVGKNSKVLTIWDGTRNQFTKDFVIIAISAIGIFLTKDTWNITFAMTINLKSLQIYGQKWKINLWTIQSRWPLIWSLNKYHKYCISIKSIRSLPLKHIFHLTCFLMPIKANIIAAIFS